MSWTLAALGLSVMLVACASPYGEAESIPLPERTRETTVSETEPAVAESEPAAPPAQVIAGPPSSIAFSWNRVSATAEYSFDVLTKDGTLVGPCISVDWIHRRVTTTFRGTCPSSDAHRTIAMTNIDAFQLCSAENGDWPHATCTKVVWDGVSATVTFDN
jgi:hypothetical protein